MAAATYASPHAVRTYDHTEKGYRRHGGRGHHRPRGAVGTTNRRQHRPECGDTEGPAQLTRRTEQAACRTRRTRRSTRDDEPGYRHDHQR